MAIGKNKRLSRGKGKKGKKVVDPFTKKEWYEVVAPNVFTVRNFGKTLVTRTAGTKIASEQLKGRVFEASLGDLNNDEDQYFRKFRLRAEDVQGRNVLTSFHGMDFTTDKLHSLVRKWHSLIEASVDVKTTDGYLIRMFCIAFTRKSRGQTSKTCYAQTSQIKEIRRRMREIMVREATCDVKDLIPKLFPGLIGNEIEKACAPIFPLSNVYVRKIKVLKAPKFDLTRLMEQHSKTKNDAGKKVARPAPAAEAEA